MPSDNLVRSQIADARTLGSAVWLFSHSKLHRNLAMHGIHRWILPLLKHKQFLLYEVDEKPRGFITWAYLNEETETAYVESVRTLAPEMWKSGQSLWMIDFVAPFGDGMAILSDLRKNVFPDKKGKYIRARFGTQNTRVCHASGSRSQNDRGHTPLSQ